MLSLSPSSFLFNPAIWWIWFKTVIIFIIDITDYVPNRCLYSSNSDCACIVCKFYLGYVFKIKKKRLHLQNNRLKNNFNGHISQLCGCFTTTCKIQVVECCILGSNYNMWQCEIENHAVVECCILGSNYNRPKNFLDLVAVVECCILGSNYNLCGNKEWKIT